MRSTHTKHGTDSLTYVLSDGALLHLNPHAKQDWSWDSLNSELDHAAPGRLLGPPAAARPASLPKLKPNQP